MILLKNISKPQKAWYSLGLLALAAVFLFTQSEALAQSSRDVVSRLNRIENELETLNRAVYRGEKPPAGSTSFAGDARAQANAEVRLQQLETELRDIRGQIEEQSHAVSQMRQELDRALSDMELRIGSMEGSGAGAAGAGARYTAGSATRSLPQPTYRPSEEKNFSWSSKPEETAPAAGGQLGTVTRPAPGSALSATSASVPDAAAAHYENAFAMLKNAQYDGAAQDFESFINLYPNHVLAGNAKYWLGETFYVRGDYERAARIFAEGYQQYPEGAKAADNLLKLGMSLAGMGSTEDACVALGQLEKDFPSGSGPVLRRAKQEMSRIGCS